VSPHGGAPRTEWRNEFAMLVRTAPIQQALTCHHRSHIFGVRELELLLASPPPSMPAFFFLSIGRVVLVRSRWDETAIARFWFPGVQARAR